MKILSPFGLAIALPLLASALLAPGCATPLEFSGCDATEVNDPTKKCEVIYAVASEFEGDASVNGQGGTPSGTGGSGNPSQGGSGNPAQGGSGNPSQGGSGNPAQGGSGNPGTGGTGQGGTAQAGGAGDGGGGAAGSGTAGTATGGTAGTGTVAPVFNNASCDFVDRSGCENLGCQNCRVDDTYCAQQCPLVVDCASDNVACLSAADPLCGRRDGAAEQACTELVEMSGNLNPSVGSATSFARPLVECLCSTPRP